MGPFKLQRLNGSFAVTPLSEFWQLGTLSGAVDPAVTSLPLGNEAAGTPTTTAVIVPRLRAFATVSGATCAKPAGTVENDVMIACAFRSASQIAPTPPAGWTELASGSSAAANVAFGVWGRVAGASEGADYTFTNATETSIYTFDKDTCDSADPWGPGATTNSGNSAALVGTRITTERDHALIFLFSSNQNALASPPFASMQQIPGNANPTQMAMFTEHWPHAGVSGDRFATMTSGFWHCQMVSLNPAVGGFTGTAATGINAGLASATGKLRFIGASATGIAAGLSSADGKLRFTGTASVAAINAGLSSAAGKLSFVGSAATGVDGGRAEASGTVTQGITGTAATGIDAGYSSASGSVVGAGPAVHFYEGGGTGFFKRKKRREEDELAEVQAAYEEAPGSSAVAAVIAPFVDLERPQDLPLLLAVDWASLVRAGKLAALRQAIDSAKAAELARMAEQDDEDAFLLLVM